MSERIVFTGADGMIGREMQKVMPNAIFLGHGYLEITDRDQVEAVFAELAPDLVIHLAALTDLSACEENKRYAYDVNVLGTRNVADCSSNFMYWCSDYIHDGQRGNYSEHDIPTPLSYYGWTKYLGSLEARRCIGKSVVVVTSVKPRPYKHPAVPKGMYSTGGYVDDMAKEFKFAIEHFQYLPQTINIGLERRLLSNLARETREVKLIDIANIWPPIPLDSSLDVTNWKRLKKRFG